MRTERRKRVSGYEPEPCGMTPGWCSRRTIGTALDPRSLNRLFDDLCRRATVRRVRVHDLRHTCASLLLAQGVEPRVIMETLGHSQISTTMDLYAHVLPALQRQAATRMNDLLSGGGQ